LTEQEKRDLFTQVLKWQLRLSCNHHKNKTSRSQDMRCPACATRDGKKSLGTLSCYHAKQVQYYMLEYSASARIRAQADDSLRQYLKQVSSSHRYDLCRDFLIPARNTGEEGNQEIVDFVRSPVVDVPRQYTAPWTITEFRDFRTFFAERTEKYESLNQEYLVSVQGGKTVASVMNEEGFYLQHGLGGEYDDKNELSKSPVELYMEAAELGKTWKKSVISHVKHLVPPGMELLGEPSWVTGKSAGFSRTHFDDYFNIAVVLHGSKTFYLAEPDSIDGKAYPSKNEWEAWGVGMKDPRFAAFHMGPGDVLCIPPKWWHCVETEPFTVMCNFWWQVPDEEDKLLNKNRRKDERKGEIEI